MTCRLQAGVRSITRGSGDPTVAIVGGIHGDEPAGVQVVNRLEELELELSGTVRLVVANERALDAGVRYTEVDLNRQFPGDPDGEAYETRLAADVYDEIVDDDAVLALHTSHSLPPPFALYSQLTPGVRRTVTGMPVDYAVDTSTLRETTLDAVHAGTVSLEAGVQGSEEATAFGLLASLEFLRAHDVLDAGSAMYTSVRRVRAFREIRKGHGTPRLYYRNFQRIPEGALYAEDDEVSYRTTAADKVLVLASEHGYENIFGILAEHDGIIEPVADLNSTR